MEKTYYNNIYCEFPFKECDDGMLVSVKFITDAEAAEVTFDFPDSLQNLEIKDIEGDGSFTITATIFGICWKAEYHPADYYYNALDGQNPNLWFGLGYPDYKDPDPEIEAELAGETCYQVSPVIPAALAKVLVTEINRRYNKR